MEYRHGFTDLDCNDFFQIHTYISYLQQKVNVILGGLIYPVTTTDIDVSNISKAFTLTINTLFSQSLPKSSVKAHIPT